MILTGNSTSLVLNQLLRSYAFCIVSCNTFPPFRCLQYTRALSALVWSMSLRYRGVNTKLSLTEWSQKLLVSSTLLLLLTVFCLLISAAVLLHFLSSIVFLMLTAPLNLLTACLHFSRGLAAQDFPLKLTLILSKFPTRQTTSIFSLSSM